MPTQQCQSLTVLHVAIPLHLLALHIQYHASQDNSLFYFSFALPVDMVLRISHASPCHTAPSQFIALHRNVTHCLSTTSRFNTTPMRFRSLCFSSKAMLFHALPYITIPLLYLTQHLRSFSILHVSMTFPCYSIHIHGITLLFVSYPQLDVSSHGVTIPLLLLTQPCLSLTMRILTSPFPCSSSAKRIYTKPLPCCSLAMRLKTTLVYSIALFC